MRELLLYTTSGCHLCEQAEKVLAPVLAFVNRSCGDGEAIIIRHIEISESPDLLQRYGVRIPVIRFQDAEAELGWPFDQAQAFDFLSRHSEAP